MRSVTRDAPGATLLVGACSAPADKDSWARSGPCGSCPGALCGLGRLCRGEAMAMFDAPSGPPGPSEHRIRFHRSGTFRVSLNASRRQRALTRAFPEGERRDDGKGRPRRGGRCARCCACPPSRTATPPVSGWLPPYAGQRCSRRLLPMPDLQGVSHAFYA
jgi:hypothetical protein